MEAPGGPGAPPMWGPGRKLAFGAAPGPKSKVWFTLADGSLSEVLYPTLERIVLHELRFFASARGAPPVDDASDGQHKITWLAPGVPAFTVESTHHEYRLTKDFVTDPDENALVIAGTFTPELPDVRLYMQASAHWTPGTEGNFSEVLDTHPPALVMRQQDVWVCIVGPFSRATTGYFRSSDVHVELHDTDGQMTDLYDRAGPGNVTVGAELGVRSGSFQLALGFAHSRADAEEVARLALQKGAGSLRTEFARRWRAQPDLPAGLAKVSGDDGALARASLTILRCLEDKFQAPAVPPASRWRLDAELGGARPAALDLDRARPGGAGDPPCVAPRGGRMPRPRPLSRDGACRGPISHPRGSADTAGSLGGPRRALAFNPGGVHRGSDRVGRVRGRRG
ncbi:MAG: hypothetical protein AUI15_34895 [Actinobacteria bacterium 13_2_20CM_2_66_6]|nr:MAG: hypothetical protein AUI15_34895 [Actinobacteria bacterium 13_2_20CM_2_66_6]